MNQEKALKLVGAATGNAELEFSTAYGSFWREPHERGKVDYEFSDAETADKQPDYWPWDNEHIVRVWDQHANLLYTASQFQNGVVLAVSSVTNEQYEERVRIYLMADSPNDQTRYRWIESETGADTEVRAASVEQALRDAAVVWSIGWDLWIECLPDAGVSEKALDELATLRVQRDARLSVHQDTIFYDWPNWDEHLPWVIEAPVDDIVKWAERVESGE